MHLEHTILANRIKSKAKNNGALALKFTVILFGHYPYKSTLAKEMPSLAGHFPFSPFYVQASVPRYSGKLLFISF